MIFKPHNLSQLSNPNKMLKISKTTSPDPELDYEGMIEYGEQDVANFLAEYREIILQAAETLRGYKASGKAARYEQELLKFGRYEAEPSEELLNIAANEFELDVAWSQLQDSAYNSSLKGIGLGVSFQAGVISGIQAGAELIVQFPYQIGADYKTPWEVKTRTWEHRTRELLVEINAGLGLSFWLFPPESSNGVLGIFISIVLGTGIRVHLFSWAPARSESRGIQSKRNPFKHIMAFRVSLNVGIGLAIGLDRPNKSKQTVSAPLLEGSTFTLEPSFMAIGIQTQLNFTITAAKRLGDPAKVFSTNESTININFPAYLSNFLDSIVHTKSGSAPETGTSVNGLENWEMSDPSGGPLTFTWVGTDNTAWVDDIRFNITNVINNADQTTERQGLVEVVIGGLESVGTFNVPIALGVAPLNLTKVILKADLNWTLTVPVGGSHSIKGTTDLSVSGTGTANNSLRPDESSNFYYIINPNAPVGDDPPFLTLVDNTDGQTEWNMGYVFQQNPSDGLIAQFFAVMFRGGAFSDRNKYEAAVFTDLPGDSIVFFNKQSSINFEIHATQTSSIDHREMHSHHASARYGADGEELFQQLVKLLDGTMAAAPVDAPKGVVSSNYGSFEAVAVSVTSTTLPALSAQ